MGHNQKFRLLIKNYYLLCYHIISYNMIFSWSDAVVWYFGGLKLKLKLYEKYVLIYIITTNKEHYVFF